MHRLASIIVVVPLTACSSFLESLPEPPGQTPTIEAATADLKRIAGEVKLIEPLEVAGPIQAEPATVAPWIICLRSTSPDQSRQIYALFYRDTKLVSSRFAAIVDRCELQSFVPLQSGRRD
ncbi:conserved hypothetical protein [Rhodopseudomonas palustris HaA2]|uniref:Uncharacterized protein n=1 Tax=Rhodopseudomonas palustris (strain HaA2) TaxID=316058 RepID=Q2IZX9_RHOP2|nr:hypothetical protein [Rhodopseudomonas palustris]ABD06231.1 conserved hypothetical protein [Rhodopseudomonas palustris HaA2]